MRALITAGGTREPIDGVRYITNFSSGTTGAAIADAFASAGWDVTLLRARDARAATHEGIHTVYFGSVAELDAAAALALAGAHHDAIVHAAAVSDFAVTAVIVDGVRHGAPLIGKLDSAAELLVELRPAPKILPKLKGYAAAGNNSPPVLFGFKLTNGAGADAALAAVHTQLERTDVDYVVHNDLADMDHGANRHPVTIYDRAGVAGRADDNAGLAAELLRLLARHAPPGHPRNAEHAR